MSLFVYDLVFPHQVISFPPLALKYIYIWGIIVPPKKESLLLSSFFNIFWHQKPYSLISTRNFWKYFLASFSEEGWLPIYIETDFSLKIHFYKPIDAHFISYFSKRSVLEHGNQYWVFKPSSLFCGFFLEPLFLCTKNTLKVLFSYCKPIFLFILYL